jgi:hypothetical protein
MPSVKRRLRTKTPYLEHVEPPALLLREWRRITHSQNEVGNDKVQRWYDHAASLLGKYPLSEAAATLRANFPGVESGYTVGSVRSLLGLVQRGPAHSYKNAQNNWVSLPANCMLTFYEDAVLHEVGERRMAEWWDGQSVLKSAVEDKKVGAALTFWHSMDGSRRLPDAIEVGLTSTLIAEFEDVYCLSYQGRFENLPAHIKLIDANRVLPKDVFNSTLQHGYSRTGGFIAVLAEWLKQLGAYKLPELRAYTATTTFDGDSIWRKNAFPPVLGYGHASATLSQNPVSQDNRNPSKRREKLTYTYCMKSHDMLKIATPWRWPTGSPAQESLVARIEGCVWDAHGGHWRGGDEFEVIMDIAWDTYNNWGLRAAFNPATTHTPVPWYAWAQPLAQGSVLVVRFSYVCSLLELDFECIIRFYNNLIPIVRNCVNATSVPTTCFISDLDEFISVFKETESRTLVLQHLCFYTTDRT